MVLNIQAVHAQFKKALTFNIDTFITIRVLMYANLEREIKHPRWNETTSRKHQTYTVVCISVRYIKCTC